MPPKPPATGPPEGASSCGDPSNRTAASTCNASRSRTMAREFPPRTCPRSFGLFTPPKLMERGWALPWSRNTLPHMPGLAPKTKYSVAEAAAKRRDQKKAPAKPAKVVTNDDLSSAASAQVSVVGQADSKGAPGTPGDKAKKPAGGEGEEKPAESEESQWRKRFGEAYHSLHQAEAELDVLQREWGKIQTQYYADPQKALKEQNSRSDVNDHQQKIDARKKEIEQLHQSIADLEDQLRKAGGDSSRARE